MSDGQENGMSRKVLPFEPLKQTRKSITKEECDGMSALARHLWRLRGLHVSEPEKS